ncbi:MAG: ribosome biogenesis GTPase RsgA [Gammaproteobacteria bacterium]|nr:ribosome biogenesis GTPase RsgA [Gammaproteobacteria bacterium]
MRLRGKLIRLLPALLLAGLLAGLALPVAAMSLDQAVAQVRAQSGGRVVSAQTQNNVHQIRVLTPSGQVRLFQIKANGGSEPARGRQN